MLLCYKSDAYLFNILENLIYVYVVSHLQTNQENHKNCSSLNDAQIHGVCYCLNQCEFCKHILFIVDMPLPVWCVNILICCFVMYLQYDIEMLSTVILL